MSSAKLLAGPVEFRCVARRQLRNVYFPPCAAAVKASVGTFMSAYRDLNAVPASGNRFLLCAVLRHEWGFKGFVASDAFAVANLVTRGFARASAP